MQEKKEYNGIRGATFDNVQIYLKKTTRLKSDKRHNK